MKTETTHTCGLINRVAITDPYLGYVNPSKTLNEAHADDRLIAAATDLLQSAKYAVTYMMGQSGDMANHGVNLLRAAIAKAEGGR